MSAARLVGISSDSTPWPSAAGQPGDNLRLSMLMVNWGGVIVVMSITLCFCNNLLNKWLQSRQPPPQQQHRASARHGARAGSAFSDGEEEEAEAEAIEPSPFAGIFVFSMEENKQQHDLTMWAFANLFKDQVHYATMLPDWKCDTATPPQLPKVATIFFSGGYGRDPHLTKLNIVGYTAPKRPGVTVATFADWLAATVPTQVERPHRATQPSTVWPGIFKVEMNNETFLVAPVRYPGCARHRKLKEITANGDFACKL